VFDAGRHNSKRALDTKNQQSFPFREAIERISRLLRRETRRTLAGLAQTAGDLAAYHGIRCPRCKCAGIWDGGAKIWLKARDEQGRVLTNSGYPEFFISRFGAMVCPKCKAVLGRNRVPRVYACGHEPVKGDVRIRSIAHDGPEEKSAIFGARRCGAAWQCPTCARKQQMQDAIILHATNIGFRSIEKSHAVYMLTLTVAHNDGNDLEDTRRKLAEAYRLVHAGRQIQEARSKTYTRKRRGRGAFAVIRQGFDLAQTLRRVEVTQGANGWHPHLHALIFLRHDLSPRRLRALRWWYSLRWRAACTKAGLKPPTNANTVMTKAKKDGEYLAKMGVLELAGDFNKQGRCTHCRQKVTTEWKRNRRTCVKCGREVNRSPWQILADYTAHKTHRDRRLWLAYYDGIAGARRLTWGRWDGSLDLRKMFPVEKETTHQMTTANDITLDRAAWSQLSRVDRTRLLDAHETGDKWEIRAVLGPDWETGRDPVCFSEADPEPPDLETMNAADRAELELAGVKVPPKKKHTAQAWDPPNMTELSDS
jgi:hypothetical protein